MTIDDCRDVHLFQKQLGNGKTEAASSVFACDGGIGLAELFENCVNFIGWYADSRVGNNKPNFDFALFDGT